MEKSRKGKSKVEAVRTTYLIAQARYIAATAKADPAVKARGAKVLGDLEGDLQALESQISAWRQSRQQAKALTMQERHLAQDAASWINGFRSSYRVAAARGEALPALTAALRGINSTKLAVEIGTLVKAGREHAAALAGVGTTAEFVSQGEQIMKQLLETDQKQEFARAQGRSEERRILVALKLKVWTGVRAIVSIGRTVHARQPLKSAAYNMRILYRGFAEATPAGTPPAPEPEKAAS